MPGRLELPTTDQFERGRTVAQRSSERSITHSLKERFKSICLFTF